MAQFYFLSILLNIIAGLILVYGVNLADREDSLSEIEDDGSSFKKSINDFGINSASFRLIVGVLCVFTAIMKILSVFRNDIPVGGPYSCSCRIPCSCFNSPGIFCCFSFGRWCCF